MTPPAANIALQKVQDNLYLLSLPVPLKGFGRFIGAWIHCADPFVVVDVGPAVTAHHLVAALAHLGLGSPELILLTHIHIDHAGGIGIVANAFPQATVVCHPKGRSHLIDPEKLWQGSLKTLGDIARAYAPIAAVGAHQVVPHDQVAHPLIRCIETPGHAAHHVSYLIGDLLFAGEAGGVHLPMSDDALYLRPATPPVFFMETTLASIDRLIAAGPDKICYGHIGQRDDAVKMLMAHRGQLLQWYEMIQPFVEKTDETDEAIEACADHLLSNDPFLKDFSSLVPDVQARERTFIANSIKGFWRYLMS